MKNLITIIIALHVSLFTFHDASAQWGNACLPEGITFTTQEQIDNFQVDYPGCMEIEGNVDISGSNITNLYGLSVLTSIGGDLYIARNDSLTNLNGLNNIVYVGGDLTIGYWNIYNNYGNPLLQSLTGLEDLTSIGGGLRISGSDTLTSLTGLEGLTSIGGYLAVYHNHALTSLSGLDNLSSIGGDFIIGVGGYYGGNPELASLSGLDNLNSIGGNLRIYDNDALASLSGLDNLTSIGGGLSVWSNDAITSIAWLEGLTSIAGDIHISGNGSLSTCEVQWLCDYLSSPNGSVDIFGNATGCNSPTEVANACGITLQCLPFGNYHFFSQDDIDNFQNNYPNCTEIEGNVTLEGSDIVNLNGLSVVTSIGGNLSIKDNTSLTNLTGLEGLISIEGTVQIGSNNESGGCDGNSILTSLEGLNNLISIGGELIVKCNDFLTSLTGLEGLTSVGSSLRISSNTSLTSLAGLKGLTSIGGYLVVGNNDALTSLIGLEGLTSVGGLGISGNASLASLAELEGLTSIGGDLDIRSNSLLTSLTGLNNVTFIGGDLFIENNDALISLSGLDNIEAASITDLSIGYNNSLSTCEVQSICDYLASPNGNIQIYENAPGCNSPEEVEEACMALGEEEFKVQSSKFKVEVFPNPFYEIVHIEYEIKNPSPVEIQVFNTLGERVAVLSNGISTEGKHHIIWNAVNLPAGLYFARVIVGEESAGVKLIKP